MHLEAVVLAAGEGSRLRKAAGDTPKQFLERGGEPLYLHCARTLARCARVRGLVFVFPADRIEAETARLNGLRPELGLPWRIAAGGARRQDSVRLGLAALSLETDAVLVHDAARPFASPALINRVIDALEQGAEGVVPGLVPTDTVKILDKEHCVEYTPDRERMAAVQTPQGFAAAILRDAHARAEAENWEATDDASLLERCGRPVRVVEGEHGNVKITTPEDLVRLADPAVVLPVTGYGYDVHRYAPEPDTEGRGRPLRLGGTPIPGAPAVLAHSDGDVLLHALADALLGCFAGGDIGLLFPDSDPALEGINSAVLLDEVLDRAAQAGVRPMHLDLTIVAQIPKIALHREAIRKNLSRLTGLDVSRISVKATTEEHLGFTGERKGIKAVAVVSAVRRFEASVNRPEA